MVSLPPLIILCGGLVSSKLIVQRSIRALEPQDKIKVVDHLSKYSVFTLLMVVVLFVTYLISLRLFPHKTFVIMVLYFSAIVLLYSWISHLIMRRAKTLELPSSFRSSLLYSRLLEGAGLVLAVIVLFILA